jgi:phenylalanyl-tRNA synthetase beta chain
VHVEWSWLGEWLELPEADALARALIEAGVEVEHTADSRPHSAGVVVATIQSCVPHPSAERLRICQVDGGGALAQVVCGADNVREGLKVAWAPPGARVGAQALAAKAFRGVDSAGMLCSRAELGLPPLPVEQGLWLLETALENGAPIAPLLAARRVLELGVTPNRADLLGHLGVAREVAAGCGLRLLTPTWRLHEAGPPVETLCRVAVSEPEQARRYVGRVVRRVRVGPSPTWLAERLVAMGQRPINNVVDVTNYVMFELGSPLHAFDLRALAPEQGGGGGGALPTVRVRLAAHGERLDTLDGVSRALSSADLVVADGRGPIALAGVIGGQASQVGPDTTEVFLEGAVFAAAGIARTAKRHGLRTEASHRFARGVDPAAADRAVARAAQLLCDIAGGEVAKGHVDLHNKHEPREDIVLRFAQVKRLLGLELSPEAIVALLEPLQIRCTRRTEAALMFAPPSFRPDLEREVDLVEEIARRHGLDHVPTRLPSPMAVTGMRARRRPEARTGARVRQALLAAGVSETVQFAFASEAALAPYQSDGRQAVTLRNPLGEEQRCLRTRLLPGLLQTLRRNARRGVASQQLFEVGPVFWRRAPGEPAPAPSLRAGVTISLSDDRLPREASHVGCVLAGPRSADRLHAGDAGVDAADLVGLLELVGSAYDAEATLAVEPYAGGDAPAPFNPQAVAAVVLRAAGGEPQALGALGQLDPAFARAQGLPQPTYALELDLGPLEALAPRPRRARPADKFFGTRRDLAVVAPLALPAEALRSYLEAQAHRGLPPSVQVTASVFDVYRGAHVREGHVSLAFALAYRNPEANMTDEEVGPSFQRLLADVRQAFGVDVRDGSAGAGR